MSGPNLFDPPGVTWTRVSPRLIAVRLAGAAVSLLALCLGVVVLSVLLELPRLLWLLLPIVAGGLMAGVLVPRQVRAWGYAEEADELLVRHGIMFRTLVVVPYGRMQYVDVQAGPLDRMLGLAQVRLHTASASTDAVIPGLTAAQAGRLRERLNERGQAQLAGL